MSGTKRCSRCKRELPLSEFSNNRSSKDGKFCYCKSCHVEYKKKWREKNKERVRELSRESYARNKEKHNKHDRYRQREYYRRLDSLKTPCVKCGDNRTYVLQFHHIDPSTKSFSLGDGQRIHKKIEDVEKEVEKCVCLCANCHKEFHRFYGVKSNTPVEDLEKYLKEDVPNEQFLL